MEEKKKKIETMAIQVSNQYKGKPGEGLVYYQEALPLEYDPEKGRPALNMGSTSRIQLQIFDQNKNIGVKFVLDGDDPALLKTRTESLVTAKMINLCKGDESGQETTQGPAYTVKLKMAPFKDMTPAAVLLNPANKDQLAAMWQKLNDGANDPKNQYATMNRQQADAIQQAVILFKRGELKPAKVYPKLILLDEQKTPNPKNRREGDGFVEYRSLKIEYDTDPNAKEPYSVYILNCYAPPIEGSMVGAKVSAAKDKEDYKISFSEEDWLAHVNELNEVKRVFTNCYGPARIKYSIDNRWKKE